MLQKIAETNVQRFGSLFHRRHVRLQWGCAANDAEHIHTVYGNIVTVDMFKSGIRGGWTLRFALQIANLEYVQIFIAHTLEDDTVKSPHPSMFISLEHPEHGLEAKKRCKAHILCIY